MKRFLNKSVIVTGGARGIGKRIAEKFAEEGANIIITDINESVLLEEAKKISEMYKTNVIGIKQNVSIESDCKNVVEQAVKTFGKLDILVNNAGITKDGLAIKMKEEDFMDVININLKGTFLMSKYALSVMSLNRYGKIINISSIVGLSGQAGQVNYSSSKAGVIGLTKSLAREYAKRNININAVAPGFIKTDMTDKLDDKTKQDIISQIPLQRFGSVDDVANCVLFLASDESSYITGQVISVNGGLYM
jgi:3-oxoacyl-[acyl-carrier protein] reductase